MNCIVVSEGTCVNKEIIKLLKSLLDKYHIKYDTANSAEIINLIKQNFKIQEEFKIWQDHRVQDFIGEKKCREILLTKYKIEGPYNTDEWLSNEMIDDIFYQWRVNSDKLYNGKTFLNILCQAIDFYHYQNRLRNLTTYDVLPYDLCACVLNTDVISGPGKHWICFVINNRKKEILFFNSSGNIAPPSLQLLLTNIWFAFKSNHGIEYVFKNVVDTQLQKSNTECGVWCLIFVRSQLLGYDYNWIFTQTDEKILECRRQLFRQRQ